MPRYLVVNGPNLNLLGVREPEVYGSTTLGELEDTCRTWARELGADLETFQSNHEGHLIDRLHDARAEVDGVIFNPGALTHTSYALHDAIAAVELPTVEVHISNVMEREPWRQISVVRPACIGTIYGRGIDGYRWALRMLHHRLEWAPDTVPYGAEPDQTIEVRRPAEPGPHPAVILVHGGFWRHMWTRDTMDGIAIDLTRRGYITANVEYRRVGQGGGWPQSVDDVEAAIRHVIDHENVAGVAVLGHSAGAHLGFLAAGRVDPSPLGVALGGVLDMEAAAGTGIGADAAIAFLGGADPHVASPLKTPLPKAVVIHGSADDRVPVAHAHAYAAHAPARLVELPNTGHFDFLERSSAAWDATVEALGREVPV